MTHKVTIYETRAVQEVSKMMERLEEAYLKAHGRKLPPELLFMTVLGPGRKPIYQITASYKSDQRVIVQFLLEQAGQ